MTLYDYQIEALKKMHNGCILCGGVGSGKSLTALCYYLFVVCKGAIKIKGFSDEIHKMKDPMDLIIITTAKKRDSLEWAEECTKLSLYPDMNYFGMFVTIDSWNNIKKYKKITNCFFIFDEQRVIGSGVWVKSFLEITRKNPWILLSATPGDQWTDYIPVFVANGFYRNKTEFQQMHCVYSRFSKYPRIERYVGIRQLEMYRDRVLVPMDDQDIRHTVRHNETVLVDYDKSMYRLIMKERWDPYENAPILESGKFVYLLRKVVNSDCSRINEVARIVSEKSKCIIFYNFVYELEMLREYCESVGIRYAEWNGQKHEEVPNSKCWVYLVQYSAGCEGWNCITCDTIIFYSQNYSYRVIEQASGRIDRINTPYRDLYYYHLRSNAPIDLAIYYKLGQKKKFNEREFAEKSFLKPIQ